MFKNIEHFRDIKRENNVFKRWEITLKFNVVECSVLDLNERLNIKFYCNVILNVAQTYSNVDKKRSHQT